MHLLVLGQFIGTAVGGSTLFAGKWLLPSVGAFVFGKSISAAKLTVAVLALVGLLT